LDAGDYKHTERKYQNKPSVVSFIWSEAYKMSLIVYICLKKSRVKTGKVKIKITIFIFAKSILPKITDSKLIGNPSTERGQIETWGGSQV